MTKICKTCNLKHIGPCVLHSDDCQCENCMSWSLDETDDPVDHPSHYTNGTIEVIDIIEDIIASYEPVIGWSIGQVIKYCARAPLKGDMAEDLAKASWYLNRAISHANSHAKKTMEDS